ncbi:MAG: RES family NAD+ phosphorylase [Bacteroidota bacterium]
MLVYRIAHPSYAQDLSGYGSLLVSGRWHFKGTRVVYTAENSSLALLEYLAHTEGLKRRLPYHMITIDVPEGSIYTLKRIAKDWKSEPLVSRKLGTKWINNGTTLLMKVPSVLNEDNSNYLINPAHSLFPKVKIIKTKEITFDQRLW